MTNDFFLFIGTSFYTHYSSFPNAPFPTKDKTSKIAHLHIKNPHLHIPTSIHRTSKHPPSPIQSFGIKKALQRKFLYKALKVSPQRLELWTR